MKQIYRMRKNFKCFLVISCTDIWLSCGNFLHQQGHSKSMFVVEGGGPYKANENEQGEGSVKPICTFTFALRNKKFPDFSNSKQEFFLISCLAIATSFG